VNEVEYPSKSQVETALRSLAVETGDSATSPFRVDMLPVHGGKPAMYTVVILSPSKSRLCQRLGEVLERSFSLGVGSFILKPPEAVRLVGHYGEQRDA
jgi:hypothetical protein